MDVDQLRFSTDGTLEGLLTALHLAFEQAEYPTNILISDEPQVALFGSDIPVLTDLGRAQDMQATILKTLGPVAYDRVKRLYLSDDPRRGGATLRWLRYCLPRGSRSLNNLAHPAVNDAEQLIAQVNREARYMIQFVRFADVGGGLFYSHISPKANVIPLIMSHFAARYNIQPFVIHDSGHCISGVFNTSRWWLVEGVPEAISMTSAEEDQYQRLWQRFYKTIAIPERRNPTVQRNFMPKRFWGDMCEQRLPYQRRGDES